MIEDLKSIPELRKNYTPYRTASESLMLNNHDGHVHHYNYAISADTVARGCVYCGECKVARIGEGVWRDLAEKPKEQ